MTRHKYLWSMELDSRPDSPKRQLEEKKEKRSKFLGLCWMPYSTTGHKDIPNAPEQVVKKREWSGEISEPFIRDTDCNWSR